MFLRRPRLTSLVAPPQVLLTGSGRVRVGSLGLPEVLAEVSGFQDVALVGGGDCSSACACPQGDSRRRPRQRGLASAGIAACVNLPTATCARQPDQHADSDAAPPCPAPPRLDPLQLQRGDLAALGNLVLLLACVGRGVPPSLDYLTAHFSRELCHVVAGLLASAEGAPG